MGTEVLNKFLNDWPHWLVLEFQDGVLIDYYIVFKEDVRPGFVVTGDSPEACAITDGCALAINLADPCVSDVWWGSMKGDLVTLIFRRHESNYWFHFFKVGDRKPDRIPEQFGDRDIPL